MNNYAKLGLVVAVASSVGIVLAPTAVADTTLALFEHDTVQYQADLGGPGPGPGDQIVFAGDVFDRPGGMFLGTHGGSCTTLTGNETSGQSTCNGTFNLAGGQIVVQGVVDTAAVLVRNEAVPLSIVGGTGMYQNASGDGTVQLVAGVPDLTDANFVLNLAG
jgi:Allene oxide cyclase barrel like domain